MSRDPLTSLMEAVRSGDEDAFCAAIDEGADPWHEQGEPLALAIAAGLTRAVRHALLARPQEAQALDAEDLVVSYALQRDDNGMLDLLLDAGLDPNAHDGWGDKLLFIVLAQYATTDRDGRLRLLIDYGADPHAPCAGKETLLHAAAIGNAVECVELLVALGLDPNAACENGERPLHCAVGAKSPDMIRRLLASGADPNAPALNGRTPVHRAVEESEAGLPRLRAILEPLIQGGGRMDLPDAKGKTAIDLLAAEHSAQEALEILSALRTP